MSYTTQQLHLQRPSRSFMMSKLHILSSFVTLRITRDSVKYLHNKPYSHFPCPSRYPPLPHALQSFPHPSTPHYLHPATLRPPHGPHIHRARSFPKSTSPDPSAIHPRLHAHLGHRVTCTDSTTGGSLICEKHVFAVPIHGLHSIDSSLDFRAKLAI